MWAHEARVGLHFPRLFKAALWLLLLTSWGTGVAWFILHRWVLVQGEFGDEHSAWEPVLIREFMPPPPCLSWCIMVIFWAPTPPSAGAPKRNRIFWGFGFGFGDRLSDRHRLWALLRGRGRVPRSHQLGALFGGFFDSVSCSPFILAWGIAPSAKRSKNSG